ncbi:hypothetical protein Mame01_67340 [Microbispora amethystogenes]|nr:hypothetical protein Mame01_67340 [Microbispora amethystogenes]
MQPSMVEHFHDLAEQSVRFRFFAGLDQPLQHDRPGPCQAQFAGQHQPVRATTDDDDIYDHVFSSVRTERAGRVVDAAEALADQSHGGAEEFIDTSADLADLLPHAIWPARRRDLLVGAVTG